MYMITYIEQQIPSSSDPSHSEYIKVYTDASNKYTGYFYKLQHKTPSRFYECKLTFHLQIPDDTTKQDEKVNNSIAELFDIETVLRD